MQVGLISDTHGVLDPRVRTLFAGVGHILHAGDIGKMDLLFQLEQLAPVTAVLGNVDAGLHLRETEIITLEGYKFLIHHVLEPRALPQTLQRRIRREQPHVVVFGHTHQPFSEMINGCLFINPGSAGRPRFHLPRTVATLKLNGPQLRPEFKYLE
jgi:uncharacterized protein